MGIYFLVHINTNKKIRGAADGVVEHIFKEYILECREIYKDKK